MTKKLIAIFLLTMTFNTNALSPDDLIFKKSDLQKPPMELSLDKIRADIDLLVYGFEKGYGGRKYIPQKKFQKMITELKKLKSAEGSISNIQTTPKKLCDDIANILLKMPDNHLMVRFNKKMCGQKKMSIGSVGKNLKRRDSIPWALKWVSINNVKYPIISITHFLKAQDELWNGFEKTIQTLKAGKSSGIIIDLRGNGGGDDTKGLRMAEILFGGPYPSSVSTIRKSTTPETFAFLVNNYAIKIEKRRQKNESVKGYLIDRLNRHKKNFEMAKQGLKDDEKSIFFKEGRRIEHPTSYKKPIYILVDKGCSSSCESTLEAFDGIKNAISIGENTGGFIHFGNMGHIFLPNSKVVVQLATDYWEYFDKRFVEKVGYKPDIKVPEGEDALNYAISKILSF